MMETHNESNNSEQHSKSMRSKKSKLRLNDEVIPKPTNVNVAEKMKNILTLKEHPYSSHIPRVAMFPSYSSPDDEETGVRAATKNLPRHFVPNRASSVTVLSKTIGSPYRHEILKKPVKPTNRAIFESAEEGSLDKIKSTGENQVFYPSPLKAIMPKPKLRSWNLTLSERASNVLKNLERNIWRTSYQMHYPGSGQSASLKIDDFHSKMVNVAGRNLHSAGMVREGSNSIYFPSERQEGCEITKLTKVERNNSGTIPAEPQNTSSESNKRTISAVKNQHRLEEMTTCNRAQISNQVSFSKSEGKKDHTGLQYFEPSQQTSHKQQAQIESSVFGGKQRDNAKVHFDETLLTKPKSQTDKDAYIGQISNIKSSLNLNNRPWRTNVNGERSSFDMHTKDLLTSKKDTSKVEKQHGSRDWTNDELHTGITSEQDRREHHHVISHSSTLSKSPVLPVIPSLDRGRPMYGVLSLLELQQSFSKSEAHRNFNNSINYAAVDLRDNICSGKKHNFYGFNCNYIR